MSTKNTCTILTGKLEGKKPLGRPMRRWELNISSLGSLQFTLRGAGVFDPDPTLRYPSGITVSTIHHLHGGGIAQWVQWLGYVPAGRQRNQGWILGAASVVSVVHSIRFQPLIQCECLLGVRATRGAKLDTHTHLMLGFECLGLYFTLWCLMKQRETAPSACSHAWICGNVNIMCIHIAFLPLLITGRLNSEETWGIQALWDVTPCRLIKFNLCFVSVFRQNIVTPVFPWSWRQKVPPTRRNLPTKLESVTYRRTENYQILMSDITGSHSGSCKEYGSLSSSTVYLGHLQGRKVEATNKTAKAESGWHVLLLVSSLAYSSTLNWRVCVLPKRQSFSERHGVANSKTHTLFTRSTRMFVPMILSHDFLVEFHSLITKPIRRNRLRFPVFPTVSSPSWKLVFAVSQNRIRADLNLLLQQTHGDHEVAEWYESDVQCEWTRDSFAREK
jgi:hypothetical protein